MTTSEDTQIEEPEAIAADAEAIEKEVHPHYVIDPSRLQEFERSLLAMLLSRRCPSCKPKVAARVKPPTEAEHIKQFAKCCSKREGFIRPNMPMQEIIFRSILSEGNQPVSVEQLHELVTARWYSPANPRSLSPDALKQVLDKDVYYGFKEAPKRRRKTS